MIGNLEPDESDKQTLIEQLARVINKLGWEVGDEIDVEIGGTQVSGIDVGEEYNRKWQSPIGTRKYNKDAFIVIKNQSRRDLSKSQPMDREFKPQHSLEINKKKTGEFDTKVKEKTFTYEEAE